MSMLQRISLRTRLFAGLLIVVLLSGLTATVVGIRVIDDRITKQARHDICLDLNAAHDIYYTRLEEIQTILEYSSLHPSIPKSVAEGDTLLLKKTMARLYRQSGLDILDVTDRNLVVIDRGRNPESRGDDQGENYLLIKSRDEGWAVASTEIVRREELLREGEDLADRAAIRIPSTPGARRADRAGSTAGVMMMAAVPILDDSGAWIGIMYGGNLLNRDHEIVDKIEDVVYRHERYENRDVGTATIFQGDLRVSTNLVTGDGKRAIGSRLSTEARDRVLVDGTTWIDGTVVARDGYFTASEPVTDLLGNVIGALQVGMLRKPYDDLTRRIEWIILSITMVGMVLALIVAYLISRSVLKPIEALVRSAERLARGELDCRIAAESSDEIGSLCRAFNEMGESLLDREHQLRERMQRQLTQSEKLASIGRLAAGVAHEINTPLTGILTYGSLLLEEQSLPPGAREDARVILDETTRCRRIVRNLLDFARETQPEISWIDINELIENTLEIVRHQSLFRNIVIEERFGPGIPRLHVDEDQIRQVMMNLILNAAEAMPGGGRLLILTDRIDWNGCVRIRIQDTGSGIPKKDLERVFDPFFTTKERGKGTGLGLSVSYGIIHRHNGTISVTSRVGRGSTFEIRLPAAEREETE